MEIITRVSGPEPGYIACSIFIVQARRQRGWTRGFEHVSMHDYACCWGATCLQPRQSCQTGALRPIAPQAAITLLEEQERLGAPCVHTPASLLRGTTYIERLRSRGIKFEQVYSARMQ